MDKSHVKVRKGPVRPPVMDIVRDSDDVMIFSSIPLLCTTGPLGKTTLKEEPPAPGFMMRKDLEQKVDPASVKKHMHY